jgi:hypothetical protein
VTTLVRPDTPDGHSLDSLRSRVVELEGVLGERSADLTRVNAALRVFEADYRRRVGMLHEQLETLELAIAEAELGELSKRVKEGGPDPGARSAAARSEAAPRYTSDAVRKLFRDVAKIIHPDLTRDALARNRRHALMIEANRAYALGDEEQLRWILRAWENSPEAVPESDPDATRLRLVRRIAQIEEQLEMLASELAALKDSALWKLKAMVDEAAAKGKDLVADTVKRLRRDIMAATNRLEAMQPPG